MVDANGLAVPDDTEELLAYEIGYSVGLAVIGEQEALMTRYVFLILLALVIAACGIPPTPTVDQASTRAVVDKATDATMTMNAPTATPKFTDTNTPDPPVVKFSLRVAITGRKQEPTLWVW